MGEIKLYHDEDTLFKVYKSMIEVGVTAVQAQEAITSMQNKGILFRESREETLPAKVPKFEQDEWKKGAPDDELGGNYDLPPA